MPILLAPLLNILTSKWLWIGIAVAAAIGWIAWLMHDASAARIDAAAWQARASAAEQVNAQNAVELARVRHAEATARAAIANVRAIADKRAADLAAIRRKINATRDESRCGPAVAAALDGLRNRTPNHPGANGTSGAAAGNDDVPR